MLDPKIIRLERINGDYYEGIVLENQANQRIKLYVTRSNIDSLRGVTQPKTIVDVPTANWTITEIAAA